MRRPSTWIVIVVAAIGLLWIAVAARGAQEPVACVGVGLPIPQPTLSVTHALPYTAKVSWAPLPDVGGYSCWLDGVKQTTVGLGSQPGNSGPFGAGGPFCYVTMTTEDLHVIEVRSVTGGTDSRESVSGTLLIDLHRP
jgi:hypothetical protein